MIKFDLDRSEAFFSRLQNRGVRIWQGVEIFPQHTVFIAQHAVFIAQQMLDQILRICKSFLKSGFFGHIWFLLFQNQSSFIYNNKLFAACEECLKVLMVITKFAKYSSIVAFFAVFCSYISKEINLTTQQQPFCTPCNNIYFRQVYDKVSFP